MTVVNLNRTTWTSISTLAQRIQVFGGRINVADVAAPAANDFHTWPEGAIVDVIGAKWAQAVDTTPTYVVTQAQ